MITAGTYITKKAAINIAEILKEQYGEINVSVEILPQYVSSCIKFTIMRGFSQESILKKLNEELSFQHHLNGLSEVH